MALFHKKEPTLRDILAKGAIVVDVRLPAEYASGHLRDSKNIPLGEIPKRMDEIGGFYAPVIVVCQSGGRSAEAYKLLKEAGVDVHDGGSWRNL
jgi:rhodanese-related sulfurtransferase